MELVNLRRERLYESDRGTLCICPGDADQKATLHNLYGPTETAVATSFVRVVERSW